MLHYDHNHERTGSTDILNISESAECARPRLKELKPIWAVKKDYRLTIGDLPEGFRDTRIS